MKEIDPRTMLFVAACFSTMGVLIEDPLLLACVFIFIVCFVSALGTNVWLVLQKMKGLLSIIIFVALMESIFTNSGQSIIYIKNINFLTVGGLLKGLTTLLRMGCVITSAALFTRTTSRKMIQGLIELKIPFELAFMTAVALRFLPIFSQQFKDAFLAVRLRGVDFKHVSFKKKLSISLSLLTPVTYSAIDKAQKLSYAMELRAFRAFPKRTSLFHLQMKSHDYALIIFIFSITLFTLLFYYL